MWVACILLNKTTQEQVKRAIDHVFFRWANAYEMRAAPLREVAQELERHGQGMEWVKAARLIRMSEDYAEVFDRGGLPEGIHGVGQYALDSYDIFIRGNRKCPVESGDKELLRYLAAPAERKAAKRKAEKAW